jgi:hypothetical protein
LNLSLRVLRVSLRLGGELPVETLNSDFKLTHYPPVTVFRQSWIKGLLFASAGFFCGLL